jgi:hypothetical protein
MANPYGRCSIPSMDNKRNSRAISVYIDYAPYFYFSGLSLIRTIERLV